MKTTEKKTTSTEKVRKWRAANPEKVKGWLKKNRKRLTEKAKEWARANPEKAGRWAKEHREEVRAAQKRFRDRERTRKYAPELLAALRAVLIVADHPSNPMATGACASIIADARALAAKAKGGASC